MTCWWWGAGAWGTALAAHAHRAGRRVALWARDPARPDGHAGPVPRTGRFDPAGLVLLAVPVQHLRAVVSSMPRYGRLLVCAKGVEAGTLALPLEICAEAMPGAELGVLTGPNFAHEVAAGLPAAAVVAAVGPGLRADAVAALGTAAFRLYGSDDPVGAQVGGAAKNVVAIGAGVVIGAGYGENARAALVTRGLAEMARLATSLGGRAETMAGLSGLGDLMLTCAGGASRNMSFGLALGRGEAARDILAGRAGVTEGVATAPALAARATRAGVAMPICAAVAALVAGETTVRQAAEALLSRRTRDE